MRGLLLLALPVAAFSAVECSPGTYWHTRGTVDCGPAQGCPATGGTTAECCCACHANFYCPGGKKSQPEDACPAGSTSPPNSTSASDCTGGPPPPPPPPSGAFSQIHVAYTGRANEFSIDWVGGSGGPTRTLTSLDRATWTATPAASFTHPTIGLMSHGLLSFPARLPGGSAAYYMVGDAALNSSVFTVTPNVTRPEVFAVYGDFGVRLGRAGPPSSCPWRCRVPAHTRPPRNASHDTPALPVCQ
jgi:hypothetical protein